MRTLFSAGSIPLFRVLDIFWNTEVHGGKIDIGLNDFNMFHHDGLTVDPIDSFKREFQLPDLTPVGKKHFVLHVAVQGVVFDKDDLGQQSRFRVDGQQNKLGIVIKRDNHLAAAMNRLIHQTQKGVRTTQGMNQDRDGRTAQLFVAGGNTGGRHGPSAWTLKAVATEYGSVEPVMISV